MVYHISLDGGTCPSGKPSFTTVTVQVAVLPPAVTVIVAVPAFKPLIIPFETATTLASELDQVIFGSVALEGDTVASSLNVSSMERDSEVLLRETPVTATVVGVDGVSGLFGSGSSFGEQADMTKTIGNAKRRIRDSFIIIKC